MPGTHAAYPPEFRRQIVDLVRSGRSIEELAKEFEPSSGAIRNWVKQADLDEGRRSDGLTTEERDELRQLRRENKRLRMEQEILKKPLPGLLGRATRSRSGVRVREDESGRLSGSVDVPRVGTLPQRLLRLGAPSALGPGEARRGAGAQDPEGLRRVPAGVRPASALRRAEGGG